MSSKNNIKKKKISRDCYALDWAWLNWLDERLPVYLKEADKVVDLSYHVFEIDGVKYTKREVIELMISDLKILLEPYADDWSDEWNTTYNHLVLCWSKVSRALWW